MADKMNLPFTQEQFFDVFARYNTAVWPAQVVFYLAALAAVALVVSRTRWSGRFTAAILALFWAWMGALYHLVYFRSINASAAVFGGLFLLQAALFVIAFVRGVLQVRRPGGLRGAAAILLIAYAMVVYPIVGALSGHGYPHAPVFGVAPCPTTIFTFGILLWGRGRTPVHLLVIPVLWSLVGTLAAINLGVPEDFGLPASAVVAVAFVIAERLSRARSTA